VADKGKASQAPEDWAVYCTIRNEITSVIKRSHINYQNRLFDNEVHAFKNFWKYIKNLRKDHVGVSPLEKALTDGTEKANILNNQFYINEDLTSLPPAASDFPIPNISFLLMV